MAEPGHKKTKTQAMEKTQLRFLTCGSVDDGKSTLIGRILFDCKSVMDDQVSQSKGRVSVIIAILDQKRYIIYVAIRTS